MAEDIKAERIDESQFAADCIKEGVDLLNKGLTLAREKDLEVCIGYNNPSKERNSELEEGGTLEIVKLEKTEIAKYI